MDNVSSVLFEIVLARFLDVLKIHFQIGIVKSGTAGAGLALFLAYYGAGSCSIKYIARR